MGPALHFPGYLPELVPTHRGRYSRFVDHSWPSVLSKAQNARASEWSGERFIPPGRMPQGRLVPHRLSRHGRRQPAASSPRTPRPGNGPLPALSRPPVTSWWPRMGHLWPSAALVEGRITRWWPRRGHLMATRRPARRAAGERRSSTSGAQKERPSEREMRFEGLFGGSCREAWLVRAAGFVAALRRCSDVSVAPHMLTLEPVVAQRHAVHERTVGRHEAHTRLGTGARPGHFDHAATSFTNASAAPSTSTARSSRM